MSLCWLCFRDIWTSTGGSGSNKGLASGWPEYNHSTIVPIFLPRCLLSQEADNKPVKEHPSKPSIPLNGLYLSFCFSDSPIALSSISISIPVLVMETRLASVVGACAGVCATDRPSLKWGFPLISS